MLHTPVLQYFPTRFALFIKDKHRWAVPICDISAPNEKPNASLTFEKYLLTKWH